MILRLPPGYRRVESRTPLAVVHDSVHDQVAAILRSGTLHEWAASHSDRREYAGRGPVFSAPLEGGMRVVVRHCRRGGLIAPLLRDLYIPPTPAPRELVISHLLMRSGVPTPPVVGFATYRAGALFRRVDVVTMELVGRDLADMLASANDAAQRRELVLPVARLIAKLSNAGAWHQDLNIKNILLARSGDGESGELSAFVLDVDRVKFVPAGDPHLHAVALARLRRSMQKHERLHGTVGFDSGDIKELERLLAQDHVERSAKRAAALEEYMP